MKKFFNGLLTGVLCVGMTFGALACKDTDEELLVYMPDGAPALSMAMLMSEDTADDGVTYRVVKGTAVKESVTGENPKADVCVLPLNLASKLLGSGNTYQMLGTVTHGNLYLLSTDTSVLYEEKSSLSSLVGKKVGVIEIASIPGLTFKAVLNDAEVAWQVMSGETAYDEQKVNLVPISDPATGISPAGGCDLYLAAEPLVNAKTTNTSLRMVGDVQKLYGGEDGFPQAVVVAKNSLIENRKKWVNDFIGDLSSSIDNLSTAEPSDVAAAVAAHLPEGTTPTFTAANLTADVISRCSIRFESATLSKADVNSFIQKLALVDTNAVSVLADKFFYSV